MPIATTVLLIGSTIAAGHMRAEVERRLAEEVRWVTVVAAQESALFVLRPLCDPALPCMAASDYEALKSVPYWATSPVAHRQAYKGSHPRYRNTRCT